MLRTVTCGELTLKDKDKEVILCGWVFRRRDHGKLIFIDLRDRYGITQVVFIPKDCGESYKLAAELRAEFVVRIKGIVNPRPENTKNPNLKTGEVEVLAKELEILNSSLNPPFEIEDDIELTEEIRLQHRYLDLRRKKMLDKLLLRHRFFQVARQFLSKEDFVEVETPILTKSTPEGARDFLVPSRLSPGNFFALPQSPQLFKQILMVSGFDKYFQIAKCFRDEDLRADRQPEFTQIDIEMSFCEEEDIFKLSERLMHKLFKDTLGVELEIPFKRLTYNEAVSKYGSDKPDIRNKKEGFSFLWVVDFPLFKYNDEEKRWDSEHHPFTMPKKEDIHLLDKDPSKIRACSYDLVLNGNEMASGSIRIHQRELQNKIFKLLNLEEKEIEERFGFLLKAFEYGAPPHGGIAFGIDRLLAIMCRSDTIRDVIAFPKTQKAFCPLTNAPSSVNKKQLKELNINIDDSK
ncbi:MAG: aspartate--tRNA ligase [Candidatus Omnitrophica bacterium]|nr:aspartate--tRNA ligase [Candidatus Omnitrophota bacterium]MDD5352527.1 aspartate--tRNA ligase [Candidatus Omnitrophota bacterium]MDD5550125.1 aspartate--tRNA ligase [Candidatus Omnitrophota bacterium]